MTGRPSWLRALRAAEDTALAVLLGAMVVLASGQIVLRNVFGEGLLWADPLLRALVLWVGLLGALVASREDRHISIDALSRVLPPRVRSASRAVTSLFCAGVSAVIAYHAVRFAASDYEAGVRAFAGLPAWAVESIVPFAFAVVAVRYLIRCGAQARTAVTGAPPPEGPR